MKDFYERFYHAVTTSPANAAYCEELYGRNLCQHGFADLPQLDTLIQESALGPGLCALDLGCGNGLITEYLLTQSQADYLFGIDYITEAIRQAQALAAARPGRLNFSVMDIANITLAPASFDMVIAIDTLYFTPLAETLPKLLKLLRPGGQLAAFWSESCNPTIDLETFDREEVKVDRTELAVELQKLELTTRPGISPPRMPNMPGARSLSLNACVHGLRPRATCSFMRITWVKHWGCNRRTMLAPTGDICTLSQWFSTKVIISA